MGKVVFKPEDASNPTTPWIILDYDAMKFRLIGVSLPENPGLAYRVIYEDIQKHTEIINGKDLTVDVSLWYCNTASAKVVPMMLESICKLVAPGKVTIHWHYDRDDADAYGDIEYFKDFLTEQRNCEFLEEAVDTDITETQAEKEYGIKIKKQK